MKLSRIALSRARPGGLALAVLAGLGCGAARGADHWIGVWEAAPAFPSGDEYGLQTVRQTLHLARAERRLRVKLGNEPGTEPLSFGHAGVALPGGAPGQIRPDSAVEVTFGGRKTVVVAPGQAVWSDPVLLPVVASDVVLDLYIDRATGIVPNHPTGGATGFISENADDVGRPTLGPAEKTTARLFVTQIAADDPKARETIVAFGDSITDGFRSTPDANARWPDVLAARLASVDVARGVVNAGISGNRILHDRPMMTEGPRALQRFDRDALDVPGARTVVLLEGINDIGIPAASGLEDQRVTAGQIVSGMKMLIVRAHARHVRIVGATLLPFAGTVYPGYASDAGERTRETVNEWIRTSRAFDAVVDFDRALRDPARPDRLRGDYDSGDHLHPNDAGYRAMAAVCFDAVRAP